MNLFSDSNYPRWVQFGLSAVVVLAVLAAMVFEIPLTVFVPVESEPVEVAGAEAVRERIAINAREDSYVYNGADIKWYSDDHSTQTASIDGATGVLDVSGALTLENDETVSNSTDGVVQVSGFLAFAEGSVVVVTAASTITPTASFQPITSTAAITNAVLADGSLAGQLLILSNENAADDIVIDESASTNMATGGDVTLTGGAYDLITLLWDGSQWVRVSFEDN